MSVGTIIIAILVFSVLIFVHELGHFLTAKWSGVTVNEFALGMGPKLLSFTKGETTYSIRAFPIGGFCAMEGENEDSSEKGAFCNAKLYKRIIITVAGSIMNLLLGLLILGFLSSQQRAFSSTTIDQFKEGAVTNALLQEGDEIVRMNGKRVRDSQDIKYQLSRDRDGIMDMEVIRNGERVALKDVTFQMEEVDGISFIVLDFYVKGIKPTFGGIIKNTLNETWYTIRSVWGSLADLIGGRYQVKDLSGPVGVTSVISQASTMGLSYFLNLVAFITVNLGVFNLLPVPALDGGRLTFLLIELVRRKPVNPKYEGMVHAVGFMLLIGLMIFVTVNDVIKLL